MVNSYGPNGSVTYAADPNAPGGYSQTTALSQGQQSLYDAGLNTQIGATNIANQQLGRVSDALGQSTTAPQLQTGIAPGRELQYDVANAGNITRDFQAGGNIQNSIGPTDFTADRQAITDNVWNQALSRLDPMYGQQQNQLDTRLANQGIGINSAAYGNAQDTFGRGKNDAYNQALYGAIDQGAQEQNTLFNQSLAQGNFANQAQNQGYTQNLGRATFQNSAQDQQYGQNANDAAFRNSAIGQDYAQKLGLAQFGNEAAGQQFQMDNYAQNQPINQLSALLGMGQVQMPQGIDYSPTAVGQTDVLGAQGLAQSQLNSNYQTQMQTRNALLGGLSQLGGAAGMAIGYSDRRLKTDVSRIGTRSDGLGVYLYRYLWSPIRYIGVMAQEVAWARPDALRRIGPWLAVDYGVLA